MGKIGANLPVTEGLRISVLRLWQLPEEKGNYLALLRLSGNHDFTIGECVSDLEETRFNLRSNCAVMWYL